MCTVYAGALWAARKYFKDNLPLAARLSELLQDIFREFGLKARLAAPMIGRFLLWTIRREDQRLKAGRTYEPPTFYERNYEDAALPAKATVTDALYRMQKEHAAMAVVTDKAGTHIGIATIKDLVEEIVGELEAW